MSFCKVILLVNGYEQSSDGFVEFTVVYRYLLEGWILLWVMKT
jgi:hypothetical protein